MGRGKRFPSMLRQSSLPSNDISVLLPGIAVIALRHSAPTRSGWAGCGGNDGVGKSGEGDDEGEGKSGGCGNEGDDTSGVCGKEG